MGLNARHLALRAVDVSLAAATVIAGAVVLTALRPRRRGSRSAARPRLMAFSTTSSLRVLRSRKSEHIVTHRDLGGYFEHVWTVHPLVGADPGEPRQQSTGPPTITRLNDAHTVVEGHTRRFASLEHLPYLDFALAQLGLLLALERIISREGVGIVRGDPFYNGLLAVLLGKLCGRPVELRVIADHDAIYETVGTLAHPRLFKTRAVQQRVIRQTLSRADLVVLGTPAYRDFVTRNGAREDRLAVVGNWSMINPVHLGEPDEREPLGDEFGFGDRPVVACISRLEPMKHPEDVVLAVAKAHARDPRVALVLVGEGAMREELEHLCAEHGIADAVAFAGDRDQQWIARLLAQAAMVVAPLAGLSLVESALSGTPIVAYDYEWHAELIQSEEEGILVPYRDVDALAAAIGAVLADPARGARLGAALRARLVDVMQPDHLLAHERELAGGLLARSPA